MSDRNFSRRRRGMRFRPSGGLGHGQQRTDREATEARAGATGEPTVHEKVYDHRHTHEIERAQNVAAGLPPEGLPAETAEPPGGPKKAFRRPNLATPAQVQEEQPFQPVAIKEAAGKGIVDSIRVAATSLQARVKVERSHVAGAVTDSLERGMNGMRSRSVLPAYLTRLKSCK